MNKRIIVYVLVMMISSFIYSQTVSRNIKTKEYNELQQKLATGWNTWYNNNVLTSVLMPEGFAINICLKGEAIPVIRENFKVSKAVKRPEKIVLGLRSDDGYYTSLTYTRESTKFDVQTATENGEEYILITPDLEFGKPKYNIVVEPSILWNLPGFVGKEGNSLVGKFVDKTIKVSSTDKSIEDGYMTFLCAFL